MPFQHGLVPCRRVTLEHVGQEYLLLLQSSQAGLQGKAFSSSGKFRDHMLWMEAAWLHYSLQSYGKLSSLQPPCQSETEKAFAQRDAVLQK